MPARIASSGGAQGNPRIGLLAARSRPILARNFSMFSWPSAISRQQSGFSEFWLKADS